MFAVVTLGYLADIAERVYANGALRAEALALRQQIDDGTHSQHQVAVPLGTHMWAAGIHKHAVVDHRVYGKIYAYEVRSDAVWSRVV